MPGLLLRRTLISVCAHSAPRSPGGGWSTWAALAWAQGCSGSPLRNAQQCRPLSAPGSCIVSGCGGAGRAEAGAAGPGALQTRCSVKPPARHQTRITRSQVPGGLCLAPLPWHAVCNQDLAPPGLCRFHNVAGPPGCCGNVQGSPVKTETPRTCCKVNRIDRAKCLFLWLPGLPGKGSGRDTVQPWACCWETVPVPPSRRLCSLTGS